MFSKFQMYPSIHQMPGSLNLILIKSLLNATSEITESSLVAIQPLLKYFLSKGKLSLALTAKLCLNDRMFLLMWN